MDRDTDRDEVLGGRTSHGFHVVGHLRRGVTLDRARAEMNELTATLKAQHRQPTHADAAMLTPLKEVVTRRAEGPLHLLMYASAAVLFVSCLNLAAALLAHGLQRGWELSVRLALGATRWVLVRHLIVDAATLAAPAAATGLLLAGLGFRVLRSSAPGTFPRLDEIAMDSGAVAWAIGLAALTATIAGVLPALALTRRLQAERLRTHGATTGPRDQQRLWTGFVAAQVTCTVVLLVGTGLLVRSFQAALDVDLGYDARHVVAVDVALPDGNYDDGARRVAFYDALLQNVRAIPGVEAAGVTSVLPHVTSMYTSFTSTPAANRPVLAAYRLVDAGYFQAVGIPRLAGDARALQEGAVIDRRLQQLLWADGSAMGDEVQNGFSNVPLAVRGIAGSVREWSQGDDTIGTIYVDFHRRPDRLQSMHVVIRTRAGLDDVAPAVRRAVAAVDPLVPIAIGPLAARTAEPLADRRVLSLVAGAFGSIALLLSGAGVYAMVAFAVRRQFREAAIRLALGASPASLRRRVLARGLVPAGAGLALGLAAAVPVGHVMQGQLFHVHPSDPVVLAAVTLAILIAGVCAALVPARRAGRIDPAAALRQE